MLTDVLLSVTNDEIENICQSVYNKCKKHELAGRVDNTNSHMLTFTYCHPWIGNNDKLLRLPLFTRLRFYNTILALFILGHLSLVGQNTMNTTRFSNSRLA